jgi:hypothetical protein
MTPSGRSAVRVVARMRPVSASTWCMTPASRIGWEQAAAEAMCDIHGQ